MLNKLQTKFSTSVYLKIKSQSVNIFVMPMITTNATVKPVVIIKWKNKRIVFNVSPCIIKKLIKGLKKNSENYDSFISFRSFF